MPTYKIPSLTKAAKARKNEVYLVASGDLRLSANQECWAVQAAMEKSLAEAVSACGYKIVRGHAYKPKEKHGFIASQREGMDVFARLDPTAPLIVAESVWQYTHHVLAGLLAHQGPVLTVANWSGTYPGLVGMLNLNGSLTKAGAKYSTLWGEDFTDPGFRRKLKQWLERGHIRHRTDHVTPVAKVKIGSQELKLGQALAAQLRHERSIMGVFDEGCMGMYNAIIPDELLNEVGVFKERLSQSALYYESLQVSDAEAREARDWMEQRGMTFVTGSNPAKELTDDQILKQCKMYIAAVRIADDFGCDVIGIQYQQGLKDLMPASDLVEGMLNNTQRPPVTSRDGKRVLYKGEPLPHFNEVDECSGLDALMTYRIHKAMGQPVESTLHDVRWADWDASGSTDAYVWVFLISGAVPPAHLIGGWKGASSERQPGMFFPNGGGTLKGVSKPGEIVWSRIYVEDNRLKMDLGRAEVVKLPEQETQRRWQLTNPQWPIMHAVLYGVSRDQFMARHKANHIHVAYAKTAEDADRAVLAKAAMAQAMGMDVAFCGTKKNGAAWG
ncbi:MAG: fucose isomerase [Planctomycetaceae bacterium]|nr:fucose isomerase [Planctomycetaceae bacterium]